jgi:mannose-6-phosphate isomerase-like protein (cupin superfamily)
VEMTTISREDLLKRVVRHQQWVNVDRADPHDRRQFALIGHPRLGQEKPVTPMIDGDHGFALTVVAATPGKGPRLHSHNENETFMVLSGRWNFVVGEGDDQQTVELGKYDTITMPSFVPRTFINLASDSGREDEQSMVLALNLTDQP